MLPRRPLTLVQSIAGEVSDPPVLKPAERATDPLDGASILFVLNVDWFFLSHRLSIALAAAAAGAKVTVTAADSGVGTVVAGHGLRFLPLTIKRRGYNLFAEAAVLAKLCRLYRRMKPDVIHHVTIKPVLYGTLASRLSARRASVVNAVSGLGFTFTEDATARRFNLLVRPLYRLAMRHPRSVALFQNPDDRAMFVAAGMVSPERSTIIRGSGVDCQLFRPRDAPRDPVVMLPSRMLWDKGVGEFVEMARALRGQWPQVRFVLVGGVDPDNPAAIDRPQLEAWHQEGAVEWWGHREKMQEVLPEASVVVLPSYREGLPKVLVEAAACGRPIVTTDVPGCREVVRHNQNGLLVAVRSVTSLTDAVEALLEDRERRESFGAAGRRMVAEELALDRVVEQTLELYRKLLADRHVDRR